MSATLKFIQNQDYEGIEAYFEKIVAGVKSDLDISGATEITYRVYPNDRSANYFSGTKTGGEVQFVTDGTDGKCVFAPAATDMDTPGNYLCEVEVVLVGKKIKKHRCSVKIEPEGI